MEKINTDNKWRNSKIHDRLNFSRHVKKPLNTELNERLEHANRFASKILQFVMFCIGKGYN